MSDLPFDPYEQQAQQDDQQFLAGIGQEQIFAVPDQAPAQAPMQGAVLPTQQPIPVQPRQALPTYASASTAAAAESYYRTAAARAQRAQPPAAPAFDPESQPFSVGMVAATEGTGGAWEQFKGGLQRNWADMAVGIPTIANAMGTPLPQGLSDTLNDWGKTFKSWSDENFASLSPEAKQAATSSFINSTVFGGKVDPTTGKVPTPDSITEYTKGIFIDLASFIFALPIPAATASRVLLQGGARLAGMGAGAAATTGALGTATALIGGGAAQNVGAGRELLREEIFKTPDSELRKKDFYRTLREAGIPEAESKEQLVDKTLEVGQLALAGGIGMAAVSLIGPAMGLRSLTQRLTPTTRGGMAGLNAAEGVVGGGGQLGGTEYATQTGAISAGARDQYDPGRIALATGGGAAIGGALGGAAGYALGGHAPGRVDTPPKPDPVDPAQAAAIANSGKTPPIATSPTSAIPTGGFDPATAVPGRVFHPPPFTTSPAGVAGGYVPPGERVGPMRPGDQYGPTWPPPPPGDLYNQRPGYGVPPPPGGPNVPPRAPGGPPGYVDPTTVPRQPPPPPGPPTPRPGPAPTPPPPAGPAGYVDPTAPRNIPPGQRYPFGGRPRPIIPEPPVPLYGPGQPGAPMPRAVPTAPPPIYGPGQPGVPRPSRANVAPPAEAPPPPPPATPRPSAGLSRQDIIDRMIDAGADPAIFNEPILKTDEAVKAFYDRAVAGGQAQATRAAAPKGEEVLPPKTKAAVEVKGSRKVPKAKPTESATKPEQARVTTEPDDVVEGQFVAKENGKVVGKGKTPEEATQDATARGYKPYEETGFTVRDTDEPQGFLEQAGAARVEFRPGAKAKVAPEIAEPTKHEFKPEAPPVHKLSRDEINQRLADLGVSKEDIAKSKRKSIITARVDLARREAEKGSAEKAPEAAPTAPVRKEEAAAPDISTPGRRLRAAVAELDERNAPDREYQGLLSTGSKSGLSGFKSWRDKVLAFADSMEERGATYGAPKPTAPVVGLVRRDAPEAQRKPVTKIEEEDDDIRLDTEGNLVQDYNTLIGRDVPIEQRTDAPRLTSEEWLNRELDADGNEITVPREVLENDPNVSVERKKQNTFKEGRRLEQELKDDVTSPLAAYEDFGQPSGKGAPRKLATFIDYLNDQIQYFSNKNNKDAMLVKQASYKEESSARKTALNNELDRFSPEHIAELERIKAEIIDGLAERSGVTRTRSEADPPGVSASLDKLSRAMNHPDVVTRVYEYMRSVGAGGTNIHTLLDIISSTPAINRTVPHVAAYVRILRKMLPDIPVYSQEHAHARFGHIPGLNDLINEKVLGEQIQLRYDWIHHPNPNSSFQPFIALNTRTPDRFVETIIHESTHTVAHRYIKNDLSGRDTRIFAAIADELAEHGYAVADNLFGGGMHRRRLDYTMSSLDEFHTGIMTSPHIFELMANMKPSDQFIIAMRKLGYTAPAPRSLWQFFTDHIRRMLGISHSFKTVFDYAMRPMQDVMDRADAYQRIGVSGFHPDTNASNITRNMSVNDIIQQARDEGGVQARNLWESTKRGMTKAALQFAHKDQIVEYNKADWVSSIKLADGTDTTRNLIEAERDIGDQRAYRASTFLDKFMDEAAEISSRTDDVTGKALLTASYNQADGSKTLAQNTHNPDPNLYNEAKREYDALDPDQKQAYRDVLDLYQRIEPERRKSEALGLARDLLPTGTEKDRALLATALGSKKNIQALLADIDNSDIAKALGEKWDSHRDTVRKIAQLTDTGWLDVYVPHRRPGNYTLTYTKPTRDASGAIVGAGEPGMERFKTYSEAEARRRELIDLKYDLVSSVMDARTMPRSAVPHAAIIDQLGDEVSKRVLATAKPDDTGAADRAAAAGEQAREALTRVMLGRMHSSITTRRAAREGVLGASPKMSENIPADVMSLAHHVAGVEYGPLHRNILAEMRRFEKSQRSSGDQVGILRRERVISELEQRSKESEDIDVGLSNVLRMGQQATYVHSLLSPSQMVINSAEMFTHAVPRIAARHKLIPTTMALTKATLDLLPVGVGRGISQTLATIRRDMVRADWDLSEVIRERFTKKGGMSKENADALINSFRQAGFLGHSQMRELRRMITPSGVRGVGSIRKWGDHFMNFTTILQHHVEIANRMAIGKAAFELELKRTGSKEQAAAYAVDIARKTGANPAPHNAPRIATEQGSLGRGGAPIMQFRRYAMFAYGNLAVLIKDSFGRAIDATTKREARYALAGIVTTHTMAAGALTWLADPLRYLLGAYDFVTGKQTAHNYSANIRRFAANVTNPTIGELITRGGFRVIGVNVSGRMGLENPAQIPQLRTNFYDARGWGEVAGSAITGAPGKTVSDFASAIGHLAQGNFQKFFERTVPRIIRDPLKSYREATQGVTDSQGRVIIPAKDIGLGESLKTAFGVQSAARANFWERRLSMQERRAEMQTSYNTALRAAVDAVKGGDRASATRLLRAHNDKYKDQPVNWDDVYKMQKRDRDRLRNPELAGLTVPRKAQAYVQGAGAF